MGTVAAVFHSESQVFGNGMRLNVMIQSLDMNRDFCLAPVRRQCMCIICECR